ncbi:MAG: DUF433 domain-containing protein [Aggregatilineales bacterium]
MTTTFTIEHIVSDPEKRGGRPRIRNTGITVKDVVYYTKAGNSVEYIASAINLTPAQIHAALSYYYDHQEEIEADMRIDQELDLSSGERSEDALNRLRARRTARKNAESASN